MQILNNAIILYGLPISPDTNIIWNAEGVPELSWQEVVAARLGINPPNCKLKGNEDKFKSYWKLRNEKIKELSITIERFCNAKTPLYAVAVKDSVIYTSKNHAQKLNTESDFKIEKIWKDKIIKFCQLLDIEIKSEINWYLVSYAEIEENG